MKKFLTALFSLILFLLLINPVWAEISCDPGACSDKPDTEKETCLSDEINACGARIQDTQNKEKTLSSQLSLIDGQVQVTNLKIADTNYKIEKLKREISDLDTRLVRIGTTLDSLAEVLLKRIVQTYKYSNNISALDLLFSSHGFSDLLERLKYVQVAQAYDKKKLYELQATKLAYNDQKQDKKTRQAEAEKLNIDLESYQKQLADQKTQKEKLLTETRGDEQVFRSLLSQAQAQLSGFAHFTSGNASILSNQTVCDDWGCYYNQRDSQWGNTGLNGTGYNLASYGCLVTSMAMVYTHFGHKDVNPLSINSNSNNFSSVAPTYLKYTITANGTTSNRVRSTIDSELSAGRPVIVGIGGGPDHFIVLLSGSGGSYKMNDPFVPDGHNINFTDHYSIGSISEIDKVLF